MNRDVPWENMDGNTPLILMNDQDHFVVFRISGSKTLILPTKDSWTLHVPEKWTPSKKHVVRQLLLYIGSQQQTVYYISRSSPLPIPTQYVQQKHLHGKLVDVIHEDQEIIRAMGETFDIQDGHLCHKDMSYSIQEHFEPGCSIVATKNFPGRFAVYLTVASTDYFPGTYKLPTEYEFAGMHLQKHYHPTIVRIRLPFSDGTTRTIYHVNVDGMPETEGVRQQLFNTNERDCCTDNWTQRVIYEMDRNNICGHEFGGVWWVDLKNTLK